MDCTIMDGLKRLLCLEDILGSTALFDADCLNEVTFTPKGSLNGQYLVQRSYSVARKERDLIRDAIKEDARVKHVSFCCYYGRNLVNVIAVWGVLLPQLTDFLHATSVDELYKLFGAQRRRVCSSVVNQLMSPDISEKTWQMSLS